MSSNFFYNNTDLNTLFALYDSTYCCAGATTSIQKNSQDLNTVFAGSDGILANNNTNVNGVTGAIRSNNVDILSFFIKPNSVFSSALIVGTTGSNGINSTGYINLSAGPILINYSDSSEFSATFSRGATSFNPNGYVVGNTYTWTATAGSAYLGATGTFVG
uniref:Uncharacterized protein n=1 Tax=viral metagenome TaxID=1070528 RepID=A0A6C0D6B1_9ZZZZ